MKGNRERDAGAAARICRELERKALTIEMLQSRARVAGADAFARPALRNTTPVVHDLTAQHLTVGLHHDMHTAGPHAITEAMAERILDQRLQDECWYAR